MSDGRTAVWHGDKSDRLNIRITPQEKEELQQTADSLGGMAVSQYLLMLHRNHVGKLKGMRIEHAQAI